MANRMLIVDDNIEFRTMTKAYIQRSGLNFQFYETSTAEAAVAKASFTKPHVVLMDINLPKANGLTAAREILREHPECRLFVVSMFDLEPFKKAALSLKAAAFIPKSQIYDRLIPALKTSLKSLGQLQHA